MKTEHAGDWPEDATDEDNGRYQSTCRLCGRTFIGHKRRVTCKICTEHAEDKWTDAAVRSCICLIGDNINPKCPIHNPATDKAQEWKRSGDGLSVFQGNELVFNGHEAHHEVNAIRIEEMHNASIEKCKQEGWYEGRDHERKLISEEVQQLRERTKDLQHALTDTLNQRDDAIAEAQKPLVDALTKFRTLLESQPIDCLGTGQASDELTWPIRDEVIDDITKLLAKTKEGKYPLPDGRTK